MGNPSIPRGIDHMFNVIYEGNGGGQRVGKFIPFTDNGTIAKSLISNPADNPQLTYDISSETTTSADKWTFSAWVKRSGLASTQYFAGTAIDGNNETKIGFDSSNRMYFVNITGGSVDANMVTDTRFEDTSKWYHIVWSMDSTQGTAANRQRLYINGDEITSWSTATYRTQNGDYIWTKTASATQRINWSSGEDLDGYIAEINNVDGQQLGPDTFGVTDTSTGRWIPKSLGSITYGGTGYRLQFANGAGQTIGDDTSGNGHDFTVSNFAVSDVTTDSPTQNHTTLDQILKGPNITLSEGNLKATYSGGAQSYGIATSTPVFSGKWYCECTVNTRGDQIMFVNVWNQGEYQANKGNDNPVFKVGGVGYRDDTGDIDSDVLGGINIDYGATYTSNDIIGVALDADTGTVWYSKNGTWQNNASSAQIANGLTANSAVTGLNAVNKNEGFLFGTTAHTNHVSTWNFGQKAFEYTPPTGYEAVQQDNFAERNEGVASFTWIKNRDAADDHAFYDSSRGPKKEWKNTESAESTVTDGLQKFLKGGIAIEDDDAINTISESYVAWNWVANSGTEVANTAGSGANVATTVQVNDTAGFSICRFTGTGSTLRFAHGQSAAPEWIFAKRLGGSSFATQVYHHRTNTTTGDNYYTQLNEPDAKVNVTTNWRDVTSGYVELGDNANTNADSVDIVAYCWRGIEGYSKFGLYLGNGNADGPFIYTSFKPSWIMIKRVDSATGGNWSIIDNARGPINPYSTSLLADQNSAEASLSAVTTDLLSNGFKIRNTLNSCNNSSGTYIYMAFADHPFHGNGVNPVPAN